MIYLMLPLAAKTNNRGEVFIHQGSEAYWQKRSPSSKEENERLNGSSVRRSISEQDKQH